VHYREKLRRASVTNANRHKGEITGRVPARSCNDVPLLNLRSIKRLRQQPGSWKGCSVSLTFVCNTSVLLEQRSSGPLFALYFPH
jgi:hypothetical protein